MSLLSQFFPSGGGGGAIGGGSIPVNIYMVGGGGASGGSSGPFNSGATGAGGHGMMLVADNYFLSPGTTYPITVGSGGSGANADPNYPNRGANGGNSIFSNPNGILIAYGGGGGGTGAYSPSGTAPGTPGGNGGGAGAPIYGSGTGGNGYGYVGIFDAKVSRSSAPSTPAVCTAYTTRVDQLSQTSFGFCAGFPGGCSISRCPLTPGGPGGGGGRPLGRGRTQFAGGPGPAYSPFSSNDPEQAVCAWISNSVFTCVGPIGQGGSGGAQSPLTAGNAGIVIIKWPAPYGAAPSHPGATNVSPYSPGWCTYCFTSSGSITLP